MKLYSPLVAVLLALPFAGCVSTTPLAKPAATFCNPINLNYAYRPAMPATPADTQSGQR
jgi:hypothetical protein